MDTFELLKKVRRVEIKSKRLSNNLFSGQYSSNFKGRGMTFSEVRPYYYGDDVRAIDWNITAKQQDLYIKVFEEERELTVMMVIDISGSSLFGTSNQQKHEMITEIAATLSFSAIQNNDKVGLLLFSEEVDLFIPPAKGKSHVLRIIRELIEHQPKVRRKTNLLGALRYLANVLKKKSAVFILSDFMDKDYLKPLQVIGNKHDLRALRIYDKKDAHISDIGFVSTIDSETGKQMFLDTSSKSFRKAYNEHYEQSVKYFEDTFRRCNGRFVSNSTDESYIKSILDLFNR